jgi:putative membrane protein
MLPSSSGRHREPPPSSATDEKPLRSIVMTKSSFLKLSLLGAFLSLGAFAKNDVQAKHLKDRDEFVEKAAMASKTQVTLSELAIQQSTNPSVKQFAERVIKDHQKAFDSLKSIAATKGISLPFASIGSGVTSTSGSSNTLGSSSSSSSVGSKDNRSPYSDSSAKKTADDISGDVKSAGEDVKSAGEEVAASGKKAADDVATGTKNAANDLAGTSPTIASSKEYEKDSKKVQEKYDDLTKLSGEKFDKAYLSEVISVNDKAINLVEKEAKDGWDTDVMTWANETLPSLRNHKEMAKMVKQDIKNAKPSM